MTRRDLFVSTFAAAPLAAFDGPPPAQKRLTSRLTPDKLRTLIPRERWKPFPTDPSSWQALPTDTKQLLLTQGESHLKKEWPSLPATLFLEFARDGNRSRYEAVRNRRRDALRDLVIAECIEGRGRFLDQIANGIWTTCEESFWGVPAHIGAQKAGKGLPDVSEPIVDLFAAETSSLLAWTDYLLGAKLDQPSKLIRQRIRAEIKNRILDPCMNREFGWMGFTGKGRVNNWNPWINSNWLTSTLLMDTDQQARIAAVKRIVMSLDRFLDAYHDDGGCDEGPGYWGRAGGSLFDCLELLHLASNGEIDYYDMPLVREIGRYIYRAHIHNDWFTNFGDASAQTHIAGDLVFRYGKRIGDPHMQALGAFAGPGRFSDSIGRVLPALFNLAALKSAPAKQPLLRDVWLPGTQVMAARLKEGSPEGFYLAAQGGHNAESHNHNDVGNFIVFADGNPVFIDAGVETYSALTFSPRRYEIWTMQSAYHNLPTIGGHMQRPGEEFRATKVNYRSDDNDAQFELDISRAWAAEAAVKSWARTLRLDRKANRVELVDKPDLSRAQPLTLTFMTPRKTLRTGNGELVLDGSPNVRLTYDAGALKPVVEEVKIADRRLGSVWGERLYRILFTSLGPVTTATYRIQMSKA